MAVYKAPDDNKKASAKNARYTSNQNSKKNTKVTVKATDKTATQPTPNKKPKNAMVIALIVISILAVAGVATFLIMRGQQAQSSTHQAGTQPAVASALTDATTAHTIEKKDMPALSSDDGSDGYLDGAVYIWDNKGFELFKGNVKTAVSYAKAISNYKTYLGTDVKVYNMVVPNNTEFGLPERIGKDISNPQRDNTEAIVTNLSSDVIPIDVYNILGEHRNDSIFYSTDNHWTNLGAYYAYTAFTKEAGIEATDISTLEKASIDHKFQGSYISATVSDETKNGNPKLLDNLDTVEYYALPKSCKVTALKAGETAESEIDFYNTKTQESDTPNAIFSTADCAYARIVNADITNGSKIAIVKDTYGDAIAPYLAQNYSEVYLIDINNFKRNLKTYCSDNGIKEVLFLNGIMSANSAAQIAKTDAMFD
ncbi:MAG TPA: hypothetical protein GX401_00680 [Clostridiales bacterium]|nr:hypothetical protein [Clostridiales bacterium]